jgi:hypothetical protein
MNPIENAVSRPFPEVIIDRGVRRKIFWQLPPLAARAIDIANGVEHLAHVRLALAAARGGGIIGAMIAHSSSVTSLGYRPPRGLCVLRSSSVHMAAPAVPRISCHRQNHRRFLSFKNFQNRLLELFSS